MKQFQKPIIELIRFQTKDVISTSSGSPADTDEDLVPNPQALSRAEDSPSFQGKTV